MEEFVLRVEDIIQAQAEHTLMVTKAIRRRCIRRVWLIFILSAADGAVLSWNVMSIETATVVAACCVTMLVSIYSLQYFKQLLIEYNLFDTISPMRAGWSAVWLSTIIVLFLSVYTHPELRFAVFIIALLGTILYHEPMKNITVTRDLKMLLNPSDYKVEDDTELRKIFNEVGGDCNKAVELFLQRFGGDE